MTDFTDSLTAVGTIIAAIAAFGALWLSYGNIKELVNDRRGQFIQQQLQELYYMIGDNGYLLDKIGSDNTGMRGKMYEKLKGKRHLAGPKLVTNLNSLLEALRVSGSNPSGEAERNLNTLGGQVPIVAKDEGEELLAQLSALMDENRSLKSEKIFSHSFFKWLKPKAIEIIQQVVITLIVIWILLYLAG